MVLAGAGLPGRRVVGPTVDAGMVSNDEPAHHWIPTIMVSMQRISMIGGRERSRNRRRLKANQVDKKCRFRMKSDISTNRFSLLSVFAREIQRLAMNEPNMPFRDGETLQIYHAQSR